MVQVTIKTDEANANLAEEFANTFQGNVLESMTMSGGDTSVRVATTVDVDPKNITDMHEPTGIDVLKGSSDSNKIARGFANVAIQAMDRNEEPNYYDGRKYLRGDETSIRLKEEDGQTTFATTHAINDDTYEIDVTTHASHG